MLSGQRPAESGAILVFSAVLLLVLIGFAALAVDLGNAWSTNRQGQSAADISATSGLFGVPRTFSDAAGAPAPNATASVEAEVDDLLSVNAPGATRTVTLSADYLDLDVDVTVDSNNSFGRAIGAGDVITITNSASGHIELLPVDRLRPIVLYNSSDQPYQCILVDVPTANRPRPCKDDFSGNGNEVNIVRMFALDPISCADRTVVNLQSGIDHLIDIDTAQRTEADACVHGHILTMPNAAGTYFATTGQLTSGLIGGGAPLAGASAPLWEWLVGGLPAPCDKAAIAAQPDLEAQSVAMRQCLRTGAPRFTSGLTSSPRFSWAIRTNTTFGTRPFTEVTLIFLNAVVSNDAGLTPEDAHVLNGPLPAGEVGAVTMFEIDINDLSSSDRAGLKRPVGTEYLEFSLTS